MEVADKTISQLADELAQIPFFEELKPEQLLQRVRFFDNLDDEIVARVAREVVLRQFHAGDIICRQGEYEETFFIILSGEVEVSATLQSQPKIFLGTLGRNDFFGEMGPLSGQPRTANVIALERTIALEIPKNVFQEMIKASPAIKRILDQKYIERSLHTQLKKVSIFAALGDKDMDELLIRVKLVSFKKGDVIIRQGDMADSMYLVRSGFVKVSLGDPSEGLDKTLTYLREGAYFGETALLRDEVRNANVLAMTQVEAVRIIKEDFDRVVAHSPQVKEELERTIEERKQRTEEIQHDERLAKAMDFVVGKGLAQAREVLVIDMSKCVNCDICVKACKVARGHSRLIRRGSKLGTFLIATSCFHCENPECLLCPFGGIVRDKSGEIYYTESCTGCGGCARRCPYGNILIVQTDENGQEPKKQNHDHLRKRRQRVVKCDMCVDLPGMACVFNCPTGAARVLKPEELIDLYDKHQKETSE